MKKTPLYLGVFQFQFEYFSMYESTSSRFIPRGVAIAPYRIGFALNKKAESIEFSFPSFSFFSTRDWMSLGILPKSPSFNVLSNSAFLFFASSSYKSSPFFGQDFKIDKASSFFISSLKDIFSFSTGILKMVAFSIPYNGWRT